MRSTHVLWLVLAICYGSHLEKIFKTPKLQLSSSSESDSRSDSDGGSYSSGSYSGSDELSGSDASDSEKESLITYSTSSSIELPITAADHIKAIQSISLSLLKTIKKIHFKHKILLTFLDILRFSLQASRLFQHQDPEEIQESLEAVEKFLCSSEAFTAVLSEKWIKEFFLCLEDNSEAWRFDYSQKHSELIGSTIISKLGWFRRQPAYKARRFVRLIANDEYIKRHTHQTLSAANFLYYLLEHTQDDVKPLTAQELDDQYVDGIARERTFILGQTIGLFKKFIQQVEDWVASENIAEDIQELLSCLRWNLKDKTDSQVKKAFKLTVKESLGNFGGALTEFFESADVGYLTSCAEKVLLREKRNRDIFIKLIDSLIIENSRAFLMEKRIQRIKVALDYLPTLIIRQASPNPSMKFLTQLGPAIIDAQCPTLAKIITSLLAQILPFIPRDTQNFKEAGKVMQAFITLLGFGEYADLGSSLMKYMPNPQKHSISAEKFFGILEGSKKYGPLVRFCDDNGWDLADFLASAFEQVKTIPTDAYHKEIDNLSRIFAGFEKMDPETLGHILVKMAGSKEAELQFGMVVRLAGFGSVFGDWPWFKQVTEVDEIRRLASTLDSLKMFDM